MFCVQPSGRILTEEVGDELLLLLFVYELAVVWGDEFNKWIELVNVELYTINAILELSS